MPLALLYMDAERLVLIILAIAIIFGATRIPQIMRGLGEGIREFKGAIKEDDKTAAPPVAPTPPETQAPTQTPPTQPPGTG